MVVVAFCETDFPLGICHCRSPALIALSPNQRSEASALLFFMRGLQSLLEPKVHRNGPLTGELEETIHG